MGEQKITAWHESRLNEHVAQVIRERADIAYIIEREPDGSLAATLRPGAEMAIWLQVRRAITEAGWGLTDGN